MVQEVQKQQLSNYTHDKQCFDMYLACAKSYSDMYVRSLLFQEFCYSVCT